MRMVHPQINARRPRCSARSPLSLRRGGIRVAGTIVVACCALWLTGCATPTDAPEEGLTADAVASEDALGATVDAVDAAVAAADGAATKLDSGATSPVDSQPVILSVSPEQGPSQGLTTVEISGIGFAGTIGVFFGESPGLDLEVLSDYTVRVSSPPRPPGIVDVTVRIADAEGNATDIVLPLAFRYLADVQVHKVAPDVGPSSGGSLVTVTGNGFKANTAFIFGDRLAIDPLVLDEFTASMHTPPGSVGRVDVRAANADGSATAKNAWEYSGSASLTWIAPGTSPLGGGTTMRLHGAALLSSGGAVSVIGPSAPAAGGGGQSGTKPWNAPIVASATDASWLDVKTPAIQTAGSYDVVYARKGQIISLKAALAYVGATDPATGKPLTNVIIGLSPPSAPVNVKTLVAVHVAGPIARQTTGAVEVRVSSKMVPVVWHDVGTGGPLQTTATIIVELGPEAWTVLPTEANVRVDVGYDDATKVGAFTWTAAIPKIAKVTPAILHVDGGTPFTVHWGPNSVGFGAVVGVRIGALFATSVVSGGSSKYAPHSVTGLAPKGSSGPADVRLVLSNGEAIAAGAVTFAGGNASVAAIAPSVGAVAGGSLVDVIGTGLDQLDRVFIGGAQATELTVVHAGLARFRTPPGKPGPATLQSVLKNGATQVLVNAYVYFDPIAGNYGTWGDPIERDVNVTVLQSNAGGGPVEDAMVVVERGSQVWTKKTDKNGQVVISAPGLVGPVTVSASKQGYTAASVVKVTVRNVTVRLRKATAPPPSAGNGEPPPDDQPDPFPDGVVKGTVSNAAKYTQLPMGDCKTQPAIGGNCKPCAAKSDCFVGQTCELLRDPLQGFDLGAGGDAISGPTPATSTMATPQRYCLASCTADSDCPGDFECRAVSLTTNAPVFRCTPRIGVAQTRCETSSPSMWGGNPAPGVGYVADGSGKFTIKSRLGDLAVYCRSGYTEKGSGDFIPLMMGITRGVHVLPGATVENVNVTLTTPMSRTVRVRLDRIPMGDDVKGSMRYMVAALNLDPEGYIQLANVETMLRTDVIHLPRQPWSFTGVLANLNYDLYGGLANAAGGAPTTIAAREDVKPADADQLAWWPVGEAKPLKAEAWAVPVNAATSDGYSTVAVGDKGWIGVWGGTAFTQQQSPVQHDLYAVWMAPDGSGDGWAGGEGGALLRRNNLTGWQASPTPLALPPAGSPVDAGRIRGIHGRAKDDVWLLSGRNELYHWDGETWTGPLTGPMAPPKPKPNTWGVWQESPRLRALFQGNDGAIVVVGDDGYVVRGTLAPKATNITWQLITSFTPHTFHAVWGNTSDDFWVVGDAGTMKHYSNGVMTTVQTKLLRPLYAVVGTSTGVQAVGGLGAWVSVDLSGKAADVTVKDLSVDLKAVALISGGTVAAGQPMIVMGPYLELPYFVLPQINGPMGKKLKWTAAPGVVPTLHMIRITDFNYNTLWELYVKGDVSEIDLPDFSKLGAFDPLPGGKLRIRIWRIYAPGLTIDHYNHKQLSVWKWVSYAYNWMLTSQFKDLSGVGLPPAGAPGGAEPGKLPAP